MAVIPATVVDGSKQLALRAAANTDTITFSPGKCLVVNNASAGPVTVSTSAHFDKASAQTDAIAVVPAGQTWVIPLKARYQANAPAGVGEGLINLEYSATATVTVGAVDFPTTPSGQVESAY